MKRALTLFDVQTKVEWRLKKCQVGSKRQQTIHIKRAKRIMTVIFKRFGVSLGRLQVKHLRWYLEHGTKNFSASTRYDHYRTIRRLVKALGKLEHWDPHLKGPWVSPKGRQKVALRTKPERLPATGK